MGNGAGVAAGNRQLPAYNYVENLVSKGHFHRNIDDYKDAVEQCIKNGEMDIVEILIPAGNAQNILPLHIAAKLGSLDACELLISAGFDYLAVNVHGHTPLHCCPLNRSNEAILCTTLLGLRGPKAVNMRDKRHGNTPLHIAVESNNLLSVVSLLNIKGVIPTLANGDGMTSLQIAQKLGCEEICNLLEEKTNTNSNTASNVTKTKKDETVDEERIMKIWGAFFENAMRQVEVEDGLTMYNDGYQSVERTVKSQYGQSDSFKGGHGGYGYDDDNNEDDDYLPSPYTTKKDEEGGDYPEVSLPRAEYPHDYSVPYEADYRVLAWLDWICCYDAESGRLFVQSVTDGTSAWVEDHLYSQQHW